MRFVIEIPDELLRGATGTGAAAAAEPAPAQQAPFSGGAAEDGNRPGLASLAEAMSAGPAEGGGVPDSLDGEIMALEGGAAPE
jgi:hypothetical protein